MRAPAFWWRKAPSLVACLLWPASLIYGAVAALRMARRGVRAGLPIICVGNFTAGGAGKTPTALAIAALLEESGESPAFLSRGYRGRLKGPVEVGPQHTARDVGDEPRLLAATAATVVSADRPSGAWLAHEIGATTVIMDDGLQNPSLRKDCAIAVVDGATGIGNGLCLPAGPLRAPMRAQWRKIDAVLIVGDGLAGEAVEDQAKRRSKRVFRATLIPHEAAAKALKGQKVLAFAGIGRPDKFFDTLRSLGAIVEEARPFPDHHAYSISDLASLREEAEKRGLTSVTTQKDLMRIQSLEGVPQWDALQALPVRLRIEDEAAFRNFILRRIGQRRLKAS
ncbi:tetraacyldisaccharide 4'-kinase [Microvirga terricola]|uniref:Tetraacyldisaccharide 4'-kinase n=1 Tax=Microvirga terricola TaxID=2719797 RepID=A0ABX0V9X6_9HYPH|nr:tetraacyldisaccharide 4'-kinase [Microvirga terricola]NIX76643.1 tetraacyldisaccharide 4'-kinase [Microvirga terricola]